MLSKSYKDLVRLAQRQQVLTALLTPSVAAQGVVQKRAFACSTKQHGHHHSTLVKNVNLNQSMTILNKQLQYLESHNISSSLKPSDDFYSRHLGNDTKNTKVILDKLGVKSIDELMEQTVPANIRLAKENIMNHNGKYIKAIPSETLMLSHMKDLAASNKVNRSYQGCGYYPTQIPSVIRRNVLENPNWYTPYTPYQAEISQGRLESLLNFQTMITELTGLDVSNASLLDEASSASEAMFMAYNVHNGKRNKFFLSKNVFP